MSKETLDDRLKKFLKNVGNKEEREKYKRLFKEFAKEQAGKEHIKAGAFIGTGAMAGAIKGGSLGVAMVGTAFGAPLWLAGACTGLALYGVYKTGEPLYKKKKGKPKK